MPPSGKSQPPRPLRDVRVDSAAPVPLLEDTRNSSRAIRAARDARDERLDPDSVPAPPRPEPPDDDVARLKAERAADADDIAAMLVRVADTERARDASERRATGLEAWTQTLEAKVAEARTRADEAEETSTSLKSDLATTRKELERMSARVRSLEDELATNRRENEDALELERVKRGLEIDALVSQHQAAVDSAKGGAVSVAALAGARDAIAKVVTMIEDLERQEAQSSAVRMGLLEQARRTLTVDHVTAPPPPIPADAKAGPTMPPTTRGGKKRSRRPPAPPLPPQKRVTVEIAKPEAAMETFEDLDLGD